jgi:Cu(I)/Ag(I) efflux system membrane fusion protein
MANKVSLKTNITLITIGLVLGVVLSYLAFHLRSSSVHDGARSAQGDIQQTSKPLYWVAPMDPNFKRDKPGKSPMGMDLIPVYETDKSEDSPGMVEIDPVVENNIGVRTARVKRIPASLDLNMLGRVEYAQDLITHIHPRISGWVERLYVSAKGDFVTQSMPLYSLYSPELVNAQEEFVIALAQGNQNLIRAAESRLFSLNLPTTFIADLRKNKQVQRAVTFYAPRSGYVNELAIKQGFYVNPSDTMLSIAGLDEVWLIADVFAKDAWAITQGNTVNVYSEFTPQKSFKGKVDYIYPTLSDSARTLQIRTVLDNSSTNFRPGMFVELKMQTNTALETEAESVLAVPAQAVIRTGSQDRVVLALGEGKFKSVGVKLGRQINEYFEILDGLKENDVIVVSAQFLLDSESAINSDFMRMTAMEEQAFHDNSVASDKVITAHAQATINSIDEDARIVNLTHGPLEAFSMMGMTMNFMVDDDIDLSVLKPGINIHIEVVKTPSAMYKVSNIDVMDESMESGHD